MKTLLSKGGFVFINLSKHICKSNRGANAVEPTKSEELLAKVNGDRITVADFALQKASFEQRFSQFGSQMNLARMGFSDKRILDGLMQQRIIVQEAERLGLAASDAEVAEDIRQSAPVLSSQNPLIDRSENAAGCHAARCTEKERTES